MIHIIAQIFLASVFGLAVGSVIYLRAKYKRQFLGSVYRNVDEGIIQVWPTKGDPFIAKDETDAVQRLYSLNNGEGICARINVLERPLGVIKPREVPNTEGKTP